MKEIKQAILKKCKDTRSKKIYKLTTDAPEWNWNVYDSVVLAAENEEEARKNAKEFSKDFDGERIMRIRTKTLKRHEFGKREQLKAEGWELERQNRLMYAPESTGDDDIQIEVWKKKERLNIRCFEIGTAIENIASGHYYSGNEEERNLLIICASYNDG